MTIQIFKNGSRATRYMVEKLSEGTTLAHLISKRISFSGGIFRLPIPETIDQNKLFDLRSGNLRLAGDEELIFARVIRSFISTPHCALIMQDNEATVSDLSIGEPLPYAHLAVAHGTEVYWRVSGADLAKLRDEQILDVVHSTSYFPWTGFFYRDGISRAILELADEHLAHIADNLVGIAVGALDFRSFLIWWKDDVYSFPSAL